MGHVFLEVSTPEGTLYGAWEETTEDGEAMEKHAGHGHTEVAGTAAKVEPVTDAALPAVAASTLVAALLAAAALALAA
jgi:hypothetical protein